MRSILLTTSLFNLESISDAANWLFKRFPKGIQQWCCILYQQPSSDFSYSVRCVFLWSLSCQHTHYAGMVIDPSPQYPHHSQRCWKDAVVILCEVRCCNLCSSRWNFFFFFWHNVDHFVDLLYESKTFLSELCFKPRGGGLLAWKTAWSVVGY